MEETLGKRIVAGRKRLGLTQDALAEQLGVTAQAVSKWENDQSCPDIGMLPKLAEVFGCTIDGLLGVEHESLPEETAEAEPEAAVPEKKGEPGTDWEIAWDGGRRSGLFLASWVLLTGILLLVSAVLGRGMRLWSIGIASCMLVFGVFGLYPKFSFFRLGIGLFGGYLLYDDLMLPNIDLNRELILPVFLVLFGLYLLTEALRRPRKKGWSVKGGGVRKNFCEEDGESFRCVTGFGENQHRIQLPKLSSGEISVSFGDLEVDLTGCEKIGNPCRIQAVCSFGSMTLTVPGTCRVQLDGKTSFGDLEICGEPDPDAAETLYLAYSVSFGQITVRYM